MLVIVQVVLLLVCFTQAIDLPTKSSGTPFFSHFNDGYEGWIVSSNPKYSGTWGNRDILSDIKVENDKQLVALDEARHHAIVARMDKTKHDQDFYVQYEVRFENGLECGGAYIKLLTEKSMPESIEDFSDETPYTIMFGPDRCGQNNKVHFIFRHQSPVTGEYEEKHLKNPPQIVADTMTHLYALKVSPDNSFEISIDGQFAVSGNLLEDFEPSVNPPKEIDDPEDVKPEDWVDEVYIPDPTATKPEDWDEDAPAMIIDEEAEMPEGWLEDESELIPDPAASKPNDWDDELDGLFEPPLISNPVCVVGCGKWTKPQIPNPAYKGKWEAPLIDNPDYIGEWTPRQIPNPDYFEDDKPHLFDAIGGVGIEIWTMQGGIMFDNIAVSYDAEFIYELTNAFRNKQETEYSLKALSEPGESYLDIANQLIEAGMAYATDEDNFWVVVASAAAGLGIPMAMFMLNRPAPKRTPQNKTKGGAKYEDVTEDESDESDE